MTTADNYRRIWQKVERYAAEPSGVPLLSCICKHVGVSERTLNTISNRIARQSPIRFIKQRRMMLARVMLARSRPDGTTVTQIAMFCGFENLGRFAVNYRRRFGEVPSETLRLPLSDFDHPFTDQFICDVLQDMAGTPTGQRMPTVGVPGSSRHPWSSKSGADWHNRYHRIVSAAP